MEMTHTEFVNMLQVASGDDALNLVEALQNGNIEFYQDTTWISVDEKLPEDGEEVIAYGWDCQVRQIVRDSKFLGGWKQPNCSGWECVDRYPDFITHWMHHKVSRPRGSVGPKDAPWRI